MIHHQIMGALDYLIGQTEHKRTLIQSYSHGISKFLLLAYFNDRPPTSEAKSCGHLPTAHSCPRLRERLLNALLQGLCGSRVLHVGEPYLRQWLRLFCIPIYLWFSCSKSPSNHPKSLDYPNELVEQLGKKKM